MEQNYYQKMSGAIAAAESLSYIGMSLDEVSKLCGVPVPMLEAAIRSINPDILTLRERIRIMIGQQSEDGKSAPESEVPQTNGGQINDFNIEIKAGVRQSSFRQYADSINAYATSTKSLQKICRENKVSCNTCRAFMMRYYPEAAQRHTDVLEGRFAVALELTGVSAN